ncbi:RagB/SusD family nutrient uptake outer membrane protein [Persicobacter sp. CCB-QB2]|uniref:RagB/SusD family nutrient uptake outer membrane protein n=1 Tax=Persicobacter sp. CCB-QB2 TaxID=1561025 RepID=UPI0006A9461E|nr:RagB/SusD family nutrient uptake outer membrane protein [Persicobacter sp. CCB-QB2]
MVNKIRTRAYGSNGGNISESQLTLNFLIDERGREFYWEGYRRQDLNRWGKFTSSAAEDLWQWKGGIKDGRGLADHRAFYPIPASELAANPNAQQNDPNY